jgi:hypothetical protein
MALADPVTVISQDDAASTRRKQILKNRDHNMRIQYSQFHPDPTLRGTINDKLPRSRAQAAVDSGLATEIPYKNYFERLAAEGQSQTSGACQNVNVIGTEWGFDVSLSQFHVPVIVKRSGSEVTFYDGPVADTPKSISRQFYEAVGKSLTDEEREQLRVAECKERDQRQAQEQSEKLGLARLKYFRT